MKFKEVVNNIKNNNNIDELYNVMEEYFTELKEHHPKTYVLLMDEMNKLGAHINIEDENELKEYLSHMHHTGVPDLWTVDQTTEVGKSIGIDFDNWKYNIYSFNYVMNMMRCDYYNEFKSMFSTSPLMKQTILDNASFYAHLAKAWLDDEDAPADKLIQYIKIVSGESEE